MCVCMRLEALTWRWSYLCDRERGFEWLGTEMCVYFGSCMCAVVIYNLMSSFLTHPVVVAYTTG